MNSVFSISSEPRDGECVSDKTLQSLITEYYEDNLTGGNAHIVFDEESVSDETIRYCIQESVLHGDWVCAGILMELMKRHPGIRKLLVGLK